MHDFIFLLICISVSPSNLFSEWPIITYFEPIPFNILGLIEPVNGPSESSAWQFCAPRNIFVFLILFWNECNNVYGGQ